MKGKKLGRGTATLYVVFIVIMLLIFTGTAAPGSVPDFSLKRLDGSAFKLSDYIGKKVIVVELWATWCKPCKKLLRELNKIYRDYKQEVEVLAISTDDSSAFAKVESYVKGKGYAFTVLLDPDSQVARILNPPRRLPFTLIIDKKGNIAYSHTGYMPGYEKEIIKKIEQLIR